MSDAQTVYRLDSDNGTGRDHDTYAAAFEHFTREVNDPTCSGASLWEVSGNSAMELCKFNRTR